MTYSISQMAQLFQVEPHTLRFYEKEGILSPQREPNGARRYSEQDVSQMEMLLCLKSTGMPLKDIRRYFDLVQQGDQTLPQRLEIFTRHRRHVLEEIDELHRHLQKIDGKIAWAQESLRRAEKADK